MNIDTNLMIQFKQKQSFIFLHMTDEGHGHMLTFWHNKVEVECQCRSSTNYINLNMCTQ